MNSKSVIFMIVTSIISLVIIFASYYGYTRYAKLRFDNNTINYAKDYLKLERADVGKKVIVSLYASNGNSSSIKDTINSLLDQTVKPDQIIINIPPNSDLKLDDFLIDNNIVSVYKMAKDYGEIGSLISPLLREKDANTIIILASERVLYGLEFIETMIETSIKNPECIIYNRGYTAKLFATANNKKDNDKNNDIIDADYGVLIKPKFFDNNILTDERFKSLDILLSAYLSVYKTCSVNTHYSEIFQNRGVSNDEELKKEILLHSIYLQSF